MKNEMSSGAFVELDGKRFVLVVDAATVGTKSAKNSNIQFQLVPLEAMDSREEHVPVSREEVGPAVSAEFNAFVEDLMKQNAPSERRVVNNRDCCAMTYSCAQKDLRKYFDNIMTDLGGRGHNLLAVVEILPPTLLQRVTSWFRGGPDNQVT